jgi:hypothetical protein
MKLKQRILIKLALLGLTIYFVFAYVFMWWPVVTQTRHTSCAAACINNLRQIDAAINQFCLEKGKKTGDPVTLQDLKPYMRFNGLGKIPDCPAGGVYLVTKIGVTPTCSYATNPPTRIRSGLFTWEWKENGRIHIMP